MARPLRVEYPGAYYHVINRGNGGERIFKSDRDKEKFLEYLAKDNERFAINIHSYCIMTDHYHLIVETPQPNLSLAVQWLNVSYATYYNKKHRRNGHLFQGRFKAILINADEYIIQLSRYIHLNPVRAKKVLKPGDYPWSSYLSFTGERKLQDWLETGGILSHFGKQRKRTIQNYREYVEDVDIEEIENPNRDVTGGFILGGTNFVKWVTKKFLSSRKTQKEISQLKKLKPKLSIKKIIKAVCNEYGCSKEYIIEKGRKRNIARDMAIYLTRSNSGMTCENLGKYFGGISGTGITMRYNNVSSELARNKRLKQKEKRIRSQIFNV